MTAGDDGTVAAPTGTVTYDEPARGWRSLWISVAVLAAGFVVDLLLGGGFAHLPGWLLAAGLLLGAHALVLHAVRSTHSLSLTATELRVGDEALERRDVVGATLGIDPELPVLGWPNGMPRGVPSVLVRLSDGRTVVVPARDADRLVAALGAAGAPRPDEPVVRPADSDDLALLDDIDTSAEAVFRVAGYELPEIAFDEAAAAAAKAIFVVGRPAFGFVQIDEVDGLAHIAEVAVLPRAMRRGIGSALLEQACAWAREQGYPAVTLTTYAEVPWNGPYYARRGFVETTDLTPALAAIRAREEQLGLDAVGPRIVMRRDLRG